MRSRAARCITCLAPAKAIREELREYIERSRVACFLLSPNAIESEWVNYELELAMGRAREDLIVIPIVLRPCRIGDVLDDALAIEAYAGLRDEIVRLQVMRAAVGDPMREDSILLDAVRRRELADLERLRLLERSIPATGIAAGMVGR